MGSGPGRDRERRRSVLPERTPGQSSETPFQRLRTVVRAAAFWVAIPLPFLYVPVLLSGLDTRLDGLVFGSLLVAHVLALSVGHPYATERE